jgi:hypothetical protein
MFSQSAPALLPPPPPPPDEPAEAQDGGGFSGGPPISLISGDGAGGDSFGSWGKSEFAKHIEKVNKMRAAEQQKILEREAWEKRRHNKGPLETLDKYLSTEDRVEQDMTTMDELSDFTLSRKEISIPGMDIPEKIDGIMGDVHNRPQRLWIDPREHLVAKAMQPKRRNVIELPTLDLEVVVRHYVYLNSEGQAEVGQDQMLALSEEPPAHPPLNPLRIDVPKLCHLTDEIALMPHKREANRGFQLEIERWREPIRDRDKDWRMDSQRGILGGQILVLAGPLDNPRPYNKVKFCRRKPAACEDYQAKQIFTHGKIMSKKCLARTGAMISDHYCIVTIHGLGIHGRVYGEGISEGRFMLIEAYIPDCQQRLELEVDMEEMRELFEAMNEQHLLQAGHKMELSHMLTKMLYFEYFEDQLAFYRKLCISPGIKLNKAALRRMEMAEARRKAESERKRKELEWLATPKRRRGLIVQRPLKMCGQSAVASVFEYPDRPNVFCVYVYLTSNCETYEMTLGALNCAQIVGFDDLEVDKWSSMQKYHVAHALLDKFSLREVDGEGCIAIGERTGLGGPKIPTPKMRYLPQKQMHLAKLGGTAIGGGVRCGADAYRPVGARVHRHKQWPTVIRDKTRKAHNGTDPSPMPRGIREAYKGVRRCTGVGDVQGERCVFTLYIKQAQNSETREDPMQQRIDMEIFSPKNCQTYRFHMLLSDFQHLTKGAQNPALNKWYAESIPKEGEFKTEEEKQAEEEAAKAKEGEEVDDEMEELLKDEYLIKAKARFANDLPEVAKRDQPEKLQAIRDMMAKRLPEMTEEMGKAQKQYDLIIKGLEYIDDPDEKEVTLVEAEKGLNDVKEKLKREDHCLTTAEPVAKKAATWAYGEMCRHFCNERLHWTVPRFDSKPGDLKYIPPYDEHAAVDGDGEAVALSLNRMIYQGYHRIETESKVITKPQYLLMGVSVDSMMLWAHAYDPVTSKEMPCSMPRQEAEDWYAKYLALSDEERRINLQVMFVGFCIQDEDGGKTQVVKMMA